MFKEIFSVFALDTPKKRTIIFSRIMLFFIIVPTNIVKSGESICIFKNFIIPLFFDKCPETGIFKDCECPACGMTRAFSSLLHLDFKSAWNYNKGIFLFFPVFLFIFIKDLISLYYKDLSNKKNKST